MAAIEKGRRSLRERSFTDMGVITPQRETLGNAGTSNHFNQNPEKKYIYYETLIYESEKDEEKPKK